MKTEVEDRVQRSKQKPHKYSKSAATSVPKSSQANADRKPSDFQNGPKKLYATNIPGSVKVDTAAVSGGIRKKQSSSVQKAVCAAKKAGSTGEKSESFAQHRLPDSVAVPDSNLLRPNPANRAGAAASLGKSVIGSNMKKAGGNESSHKRIKSEMHVAQLTSESSQVRDNPYKRAIKVIYNKRKEAASSKKASELYQSLQNPTTVPLVQAAVGEAKASTSISSPLEVPQSSVKPAKAQPRGESGRERKLKATSQTKYERPRTGDAATSAHLPIKKPMTVIQTREHSKEKRQGSTKIRKTMTEDLHKRKESGMSVKEHENKKAGKKGNFNKSVDTKHKDSAARKSHDTRVIKMVINKSVKSNNISSESIRSNSLDKQKRSLILTEKQQDIIRADLPVKVDINSDIIVKPYSLADLIKEFKLDSKRERDLKETLSLIKESWQRQKEAPKTVAKFYKVGKVLGKGAFGKVNLGIHKLTGKFVAIKSISKEVMTDERSKNKVMREVSIWQELQHPSVIRLYESFESEKHLLYVEELCAGGDLLTYVRKRRKLKEPAAKFVLKQILDGLHYCHSKSILHRDIKLDNILLNSEGRIKASFIQHA